MAKAKDISLEAEALSLRIREFEKQIAADVKRLAEIANAQSPEKLTPSALRVYSVLDEATSEKDAIARVLGNARSALKDKLHTIYVENPSLPPGWGVVMKESIVKEHTRPESVRVTFKVTHS